jgi:hypothetical protein
MLIATLETKNNIYNIRKFLLRRTCSWSQIFKCSASLNGKQNDKNVQYMQVYTVQKVFMKNKITMYNIRRFLLFRKRLCKLTAT